MDMCPEELERHFVLNSDRSGRCPKVKSTTTGFVEQMWHKPDQMEFEDMSHPAEEEYDGDWEEVYAVGGSNDKGKGKPRAVARDSKAAREPGRAPANAIPGSSGARMFPITSHTSATLPENKAT